ncbi:hypothetical protein [Desulfosporosinus sp. OT]|uniref:hypothetical protein n=1 Tax=Desulfosporosinus sp. OT TaxID=913865 RepID=UPI000305E70A|nr:hypothetical protein [Desulfosporosinus sp. OT]
MAAKWKQKKKNQIVYRTACQYLHEIRPDQITSDELQKYFVGDRRDLYLYAEKQVVFCEKSSCNCRFNFGF